MSELLNALLEPISRSAGIGVPAAVQRGSERSLPGSLEDIASYYRARTDASSAGLADRIWTDLELDGVFRKTDRCRSAVGQQVLYDMLRRPDQVGGEVAARESIIRSLEQDPETRTIVRQSVGALRNRSAYDLFRLFEEDLPRRPSLAPVFPLLALTSALALLLMAFAPGVGILLLTATMCTNIGIKMFFASRLERLIRPMLSLPALVEAGKSLAMLDAVQLTGQGDLRERCEKLRWLKGPARWLVAEDYANELVGSFAAWVNLIFLVDVNAFVFSVERLRSCREDLRAVFRTVGTLDAVLAIASVRKALPYCSSPTFTTDRRTLVGEGIFHPLLAEPVMNDVHLAERSLLITGSNMSGKSTYLRAIGTCAVMAQTVATVPAKSWRAPRLRVETLIQRRDDLVEGKSYFLAEAERVKEMLDLSAGEEPCVFIIDELYRGTNTAERVAAASAVLQHLHQAGHLCIVATHDTELLTILGADWDRCYFSENVDLDELSFDYTVRPGVSQRPNALRLLAHLRYPPEVVDRAYETHRTMAKTEQA